MKLYNFFLILFALILSFEFLTVMAFVISKQIWINNLEMNDYKLFMLEIALFASVAFYLVNKKK